MTNPTGEVNAFLDPVNIGLFAAGSVIGVIGGLYLIPRINPYPNLGSLTP